MSSYALSFKSSSDLLKFLEEQDMQYVDFNFTDLSGKWQHTTYHTRAVSKNIIEKGVFVDGSSIPGWQTIYKSDIGVLPDISKVCLDPFAAQKTIKIFCDIFEPETNKPYEYDPRYVAKQAETYLKKSGIADTANFGPEPEFFLFEDVQVHTRPNHMGFYLHADELPESSGTEYANGNMGHRPQPKSGYLPESPVDSMSDIRGEMLTVMHNMGLDVEKHHHEVAPAQCEINFAYASLKDCADNFQIYKHAVHNVANSYGKTATFMPKPVYGDNGSGMHVHQSLWKGGKPLFAGDEEAGLSETALYYIGGIIKHARALNAFTNPTTNSYKRLIPGYEAPVLLAYSSRNRSAACRIPATQTPSARRIEVRFPDPCANPYLAFSAMLMAGLDGIENKIHPGEAMDQNLYDLSKKELLTIPYVCRSLSEAIESLKNDQEFLKKGDVFPQSLIDNYIALKMEEIETLDTTPHPAEFKMYYSS